MLKCKLIFKNNVFLWFLPSFQRDQILNEDVLPVQEDDSLMSSHPIIVTVSTPAEITSVFDGISYSKVGKIQPSFEQLPDLRLSFVKILFSF